MKNIPVVFLLGIIMSCFVIACESGKQETTQTEKPETEETKKEETTPKDSATTEAIPDLPGKGIYTTYCSVCHQVDGKGVPNMNPPLVNKEWVGGDKT